MIDDEQFVRTAVSMQIESFGYSVVGDAAHVIDEFRTTHAGYSCVMLDLVMPGMNGSAAAKKLRKKDPGIPIVLMSGFPKNAQVRLLLKSGRTGFTQKSFTRKDLGKILPLFCRIT